MNERPKPSEELNPTTPWERDARIIRDIRTVLLITLAAIGIGVSISPIIPRSNTAGIEAPHRTLDELDRIAREEASMPKVTPLHVGDLDNGIFNVKQAAGSVVDGGVDSQEH